MGAFKSKGLEDIVLCPGSRSGPLALAASRLQAKKGLKVYTAIDERSAAFFALGLSAASGKVSAVITTSGSAVANLLPAAVEADRSCQPIIFITADRPNRLKNCGANQTVNQEDFLIPACRWFGEGPPSGAHNFTEESLNYLVTKSWDEITNFTGPIHINIAFEEPLHASIREQREADKVPIDSLLTNKNSHRIKKKLIEHSLDLCKLDPNSVGIVIAGPWRGKKDQLKDFLSSLEQWHAISNWPIFADPSSAIPSNQSGLIFNWDQILTLQPSILSRDIQVLRLGSLPASRVLEVWLKKSQGVQVVITEGDMRQMDPLKLSKQWSFGFTKWLQTLIDKRLIEKNHSNKLSSSLLNNLKYIDVLIDNWLEINLPLRGEVNEPALARLLPKIIPAEIPTMLAASSPIRDWISFAGEDALSRRCYSFRGVSGIDGTLSLGMGLAMILGTTFLICGDLALLHDSNGWLFRSNYMPPLKVVLIDNGGGGIFSQLNLKTLQEENFKNLFTMPQEIDHLYLAKAHGIPYRQVACLEDLETAIEWSLSKAGPVLIRLCSNATNDSSLRLQLRNSLIKYVGEISRKNPTNIDGTI